MTEQRQRREISAIIRAPNKEQLDKMLLKMERYSARTDMQPIDIHSLREVPGGWEAVVTAHNWNPLGWFREQKKKHDEKKLAAASGTYVHPDIKKQMAKHAKRTVKLQEETGVKGAVTRKLQAPRSLLATERAATAEHLRRKGLEQDLETARAKRRGWLGTQARALGEAAKKDIQTRVETRVGDITRGIEARTAEETTTARMAEAVATEKARIAARGLTRQERIGTTAQRQAAEHAERQRQRFARSATLGRVRTAAGIERDVKEWYGDEWAGIVMKPIKTIPTYGVKIGEGTGLQRGAMYLEKPKEPKLLSPLMRGRGLLGLAQFTASQKTLIAEKFKQKYPGEYDTLYQFAAQRTMKLKPDFEDLYEAAQVSEPEKWQAVVEEVTGGQRPSTLAHDILDIGPSRSTGLTIL